MLITVARREGEQAGDTEAGSASEGETHSGLNPSSCRPGVVMVGRPAELEKRVSEKPA
jgi:hypothetical protein